MERDAIAAVAAAASPFAGRLRLGTPDGRGCPSEREIPAERLRDPEEMGRHLDAMLARYPGGDRRAAASLWIKRYLGALLPGPLAALARMGAGFDAAAGSCAVVLDGGVPVAVRIERLEILPPARALERLFRDHVEPVLDAARSLTGLSERVLWSNAGNVAAHTLGTIRHAPEAPALYADLLEASRLPWRAGPNPLRGAVTWVRIAEPGLPARVHRRRLCCLRWRLGEPYCYSCPRIDLEGCKAILRAEG